MLRWVDAIHQWCKPGTPNERHVRTMLLNFLADYGNWDAFVGGSGAEAQRQCGAVPVWCRCRPLSCWQTATAPRAAALRSPSGKLLQCRAAGVQQLVLLLGRTLLGLDGGSPARAPRLAAPSAAVHVCQVRMHVSRWGGPQAGPDGMACRGAGSMSACNLCGGMPHCQAPRLNHTPREAHLLCCGPLVRVLAQALEHQVAHVLQQSARRKAKWVPWHKVLGIRASCHTHPAEWDMHSCCVTSALPGFQGCSQGAC